MRLAALTFVALLALTPASTRASSLRAEGPAFRDATGGVVILRGVNVSGNAKVPPFRALRSASELDPLPPWGVNVIRLLVTWEAFEPTKDVVDESYLDEIATVAEAAWARGIFVVIDFHQDAFSRFSIGGCGDGFPAWSLPPDVMPATPDNGPSCSNWGLRTIGDAAMMASFTSFHRDDDGKRTHYLAMIAAFARRLAANPGVIGYDVMNEPWGDEPTEIAELHRLAITAIRAEDPTAIVFLSPHALTSSGLTDTKLAAPTENNVAYAPHFYDPLVIVLAQWNGPPPDAPFQLMRGTASAWNVPLFIGELGAPAMTTNVTGYMDALHDHLNETFASCAQWVYTPAWTPDAKDGWNTEDLSIVDDAGRLRANFRPRPYPQRIAGTPTSVRVTHEAELADNVFELVWEHAPTAGTTDVFLPRETFFGTTDVEVTTEGEDLGCTFEDARMRCTSAVAGAKKVVVRLPNANDAGAGEGGVVGDAPADGVDAAEPIGGGSSPGGCGCELAKKAPNGSACVACVVLLMASALSVLRGRRSPRRT